MKRKLFNIEANIISIGKPETFVRTGMSPLSKQLIGLKTDDGQSLFCELRSNNFSKAKYFRIGMKVSASYNFGGSEKNGKQYNNIIINEIDII